MSAALPSPADCCGTCPPSSCANPINLSLLLPEIISNGLGLFNVKAYGATGDGITNDASAIQAAISAAAGGGVIFFPDGDYYVNPGTTVSYGVLFAYRSNVVFLGSGNARILVGPINQGQYAVFGADLTALPINNVQFHNLRIEHTLDPTTHSNGQAIGCWTAHDGVANSIQNVVVEGCQFKNFGSAIYVIQRTTLGGVTRQVRHVRITDCYSESCPGSFATVDGEDIEVSGCTAYGYTTNPALAYDAISCHSGQNILIENNKFYDFTTVGNIINIRNSPENMSGTKNVMVIGNLLKNCRSIQIALAAGENVYGVQNVSICGNVITDTEVGVYITCGAGTAPFSHFTIDDNTINGTSGIAIACNTAQYASYVSICGNNIHAACPGYGLSIVAAEIASISGNMVTCDSALITDRVLTASYLNGVSFIGNHLIGNYNATTTIEFSRLTECNINGNFFYNKWQVVGSFHLGMRGNSFLSGGVVKEFTVSVDPLEISDDIMIAGAGSVPLGGSWQGASRVNNIYGAATGQPMGWVCDSSGTFGALVGVTANTLINTVLVTVSDAANLLVGQYITIAGVTGVKQIVSISGNNLNVNTVCDATVLAAAVAWAVPHFVAMANYA